MERVTITQLANKIQTEGDAYAFLESIRWANGVFCPHCGSVASHYFLTPENGTSRKTRTGSASERRVWKCRDCRKQFSVITGTVMHGSKASIRVWLFVIFEMAANKNGIAAYEIQRKYGVANRTAWFMCHRVREAMKRRDPTLMLGTIVADETFIGGDKRNWHRSDPRLRPVPVVPGEKGDPYKTPVLALICAETGEARSQVVANVTGKTLRKAIYDQVAMEDSHLQTDEAKAYGTFSDEFLSHQAVNHSAGEYVRNGAGTNMAENYFAQLKRSLDGTHHHVSPEHLPRYLSEFDFRYSNRRLTDTERMGKLVGQSFGRRLTYKTAR
jgi:transposase-like protein